MLATCRHKDPLLAPLPAGPVAAPQLQGRVQAKEQENSELMAMCDQLMALQEAGRGPGGA